MSLINVSNLTFAYEGSYDNIFENVCFQIDTDWKLGLIGRNGRGKTTLLNLLLGKYPYRGTISSGISFEYFPYEVSDKSCCVLDIAGKTAPDVPEWKIIRELNLLKVSEDVLYRPFNTLSNGEQTKILLAAMFLRDNRFLLIDEPTNHLDMDARETVGRYLDGKHGFILVSHDRAFLDNCVDHILSINRSGIEVQKGNFSSWQHNKDLQDRFELAENEKLKKDIRRLESASRRVSNWSDKVEKTKRGTTNSGVSVDRGYVGHQAAKMMKRSKSIEQRRQKAVGEKSRLLKNIDTPGELQIHPLIYRADPIIQLKDVSIAYGDKTVCRDVSFDIRRGEKVALRGRNGSGKSSILKLIMGRDIPHTGAVIKGGDVIISYVPQDTGLLRGDLSRYASEYNLDEPLFKAILIKLGFIRTQFEKNMEDFSAGQKKKVLIAKSLSQKTHLYIWDEPLNYIDVMSRMQIEQLLTEYSPTMLFVEHDRAFCENIATKAVNL